LRDRANIPEITEEEASDFLSFLQVIGFLTVFETHQDIKKRVYELPILFKASPLPINTQRLELKVETINT